MNLLLLTHMLLWAATETLPKKAETIVADANNFLYFSVASICEISIKYSLGRYDFKIEPDVFLRSLLGHHYLELPIISQHALALKELPPFHKDHFDRLLIAQGDGHINFIPLPKIC
jgi:PIN domain nuclease of toxin-antitoxin system